MLLLYLHCVSYTKPDAEPVQSFLLMSVGILNYGSCHTAWLQHCKISSQCSWVSGAVGNTLNILQITLSASLYFLLSKLLAT